MSPTPSRNRPKSNWVDGDYEAHWDHIPMVSARFVKTGLLNQLGQPILRLRSRPVGFRANLDQPVYAVDEDHSPHDADD